MSVPQSFTDLGIKFDTGRQELNDNLQQLSSWLKEGFKVEVNGWTVLDDLYGVYVLHVLIEWYKGSLNDDESGVIYCGEKLSDRFSP